MSPRLDNQGSPRDSERHPIRDGLITAAVYAAEAVSTVQGTPPHLIPTPATPAGQPLITNEERELADVKRKQDEDRLFDLEHAVRPPDRAEHRDRDTRPER